MALITGFKTNQDHIEYCNAHDTCLLCKHELMTKAKLSLTEATAKLSGKLTNKQALKFNLNGRSIVICQEHVKRAHVYLDVTQGENADAQR